MGLGECSASGKQKNMPPRWGWESSNLPAKKKYISPMGLGEVSFCDSPIGAASVLLKLNPFISSPIGATSWYVRV
jgi:hypothetical protein